MLPNLSPVPRFPAYTGPFPVGSAVYEIPVTEFSSSSPPPDPSITSVKFRIFYPAEDSTKPTKPVYWIPEPQHEWVSAYCRFLGIPSALSNTLSYVPNVLKHIRIPAASNAVLRTPTGDRRRWPLMIFSHGLGGSFNGYSYIAASLASYGLVVVAPEHRDASAPISIIRNVDGSVTRFGYKSIRHTLDPEVLDARNEQLRIRLWELELIHQAILNLDEGMEMRSVAEKADSDLPTFTSCLDVQEPGQITWAGHSFGAATMVQFVKSVFWKARPSSEKSAAEPHLAEYKPLFVPRTDSRLTAQITPRSPLVLLDMWTMPLWGCETRWLWDKPLPCHAIGGTGGNNVLAIMSEQFFKWTTLLERVKCVLSPTPGRSHACEVKQQGSGPRIFYPLKSAHLSQSDFGVLFSWMMRRWLGTEEPERTLKLNVRAILQMLRECGIPVQPPTQIDREESNAESDEDDFVKVEPDADGTLKLDEHDMKILADTGDIRGWISVRVDGD